MTTETSLHSFATHYDVILCDVWGVVHNGVAAWPTACDALTRFRAGGGTVVLVSNAPRPHNAVIPQLDGLHVPRTAWDRIVTSGDVTQHEITRHGATKVHHIGPDRDLGVLEGLPVQRVAPAEAELALVTGLDDDATETPEDYRARLEALREHDLELICANPDRVVEKGDRLLWCAGAIADLYEEMGGRVVFAGKPYRPIYEEALALAQKLRGADVPLSRVLAVGDGMRTDVAGAAAFGVDCLFMTGGIHGADVGDPPVPEKVAALFAKASCAPIGWAKRLVWN